MLTIQQDVYIMPLAVVSNPVDAHLSNVKYSFVFPCINSSGKNK